MTYYYEVWVASRRYHKPQPLTYSSDKNIPSGTIVSVPLQSSVITGVIVHSATAPQFTTKPITNTLNLAPYPIHLLELMDWMRYFYPAPSGIITQQFIPSKLINKAPIPPLVDCSQISVDVLPPLTRQQSIAVRAINNNNGTFILHGRTGTGKTRVYLEAVKTAAKQGQSSIILTPEISLTTQLVNNLQRYLSIPVVLMHSQLSETQHRTVWRQILESKSPVVVVGARSALFVPLSNLGVIVIDECHEPSYKQDQSPHYLTLRVASKLRELTKSKLIFGSATPNLSEYYWAEQKNIPILKLTELPIRPKNFSIQIVDIKKRDNYNRSQYLSDSLINAISTALNHKEQSLLFLNRRGSARLVFCQNCGWQVLCTRCHIPLIYHGDTHEMTCHVCAYKTTAPSVCQKCGSVNILFKGIGTKSLHEEINKLFPQATTQRFDSDNKKSERFELHYNQIQKGNVDILIGTQSLAKGLDLPKLRMVGVICADIGLYSPDYTASERTYQLLSQVIGRVGRGHTEGDVVIQTYMPDNPTLLAAVNLEWNNFYHKQLAERKKFFYPPFCHILKLNCRRSTQKSVKASSDKLVGLIKNSGLKVVVMGPTPSFREKINNRYNWQIVLKSVDRQELLKVINLLPSGWTYDIDPVNLL